MSTPATESETTAQDQEPLVGPGSVRSRPIPAFTPPIFLVVLWQLIKRIWGWLAYGIGSFFLVLVILSLIINMLMSGSFSSGHSGDERVISGSGGNKIAILPLEGVIGADMSNPLADGTSISLAQVDAFLTRAADDESVKAIVLAINSPGGSAVVSEDIYQSVKAFREANHKPVVSSFGDVAASGGLYLAMASDRIVAHPGTITGSIGVILEYYTATGLMEKVGVKAEVIKSGPYKDIASPSRETTAEERAILQSIVDASYGQFVDRVAAGRKLDEQTVRKLADGRVYSGGQAQEQKLVDALGGRAEAIAEAKQLAKIDEATVVEYTSGGLLEQLLGGVSSRVARLNPLASVERLAPTASTSLQYLWRP